MHHMLLGVEILCGDLGSALDFQSLRLLQGSAFGGGFVERIDTRERLANAISSSFSGSIDCANLILLIPVRVPVSVPYRGYPAESASHSDCACEEEQSGSQ